MSKSISTALRAHLDQDVTALCTCWEITRQDGEVIRVTDSDTDVTLDGATYISAGAYRRTAVEGTATLSVDNLDVVGVVNQLSLPVNDLRIGLFDNAQVKISVTPWHGAVDGPIKLRRGFFGEVRVLPNGTYQVELRGLMQRLAYTYTKVFNPTCAHDLGDPRCGVPIEPTFVARSTAYAVGDYVRAPQVAGRSGTAYKLGLGDASFELVGAAGEVATSLYWRSTGAATPNISAVAKTGTYSLAGGTGNSAVVQEVDLVADGVSVDAIDAGTVEMNLQAWRRDSGDQGKLSLYFLDDDFNTLGFGSMLNTTASISTPTVTVTGDFTIEAWVYPTGSSGGLTSEGSSNDTGTATGMSFHWNGNLLPRFTYNGSGIGDITTYATSSVALELNAWNHVAVVRDGTDMFVYVNGVQVGSSSSVTATDLLITSFFNYFGTAFSGSVDELRVWNTARTQYEINLNKNSTVDSSDPDLVRYYRFNDGSTLTDETGNNPTPLTIGSATISSSTAPIAVSSADTTSDGTQTTGFEDVGTTWVLRTFTDAVVPRGTRYVRVEFATNLVAGTTSDSYIDGIYGWSFDTSGTTIYSADLGDVYWECTTAGTTSASDVAYSGIAGATTNDGTAVFTARDAWTRAGIVTESDGTRVFRAIVADARAVDAWFDGGLVTFETGPNVGSSMEVKSWDSSTGELELFLSMPNNIEAGDQFRIYPGCDKTRVSCAALFGNIINFFGFPDVPGQDDLYKYPDAA